MAVPVLFSYTFALVLGKYTLGSLDPEWFMQQKGVSGKSNPLRFIHFIPVTLLPGF